MNDYIKRVSDDGPITYSIVDNSIKDNNVASVDYIKAALPISADTGLVNVLQSFDDVTIVNQEYGNVRKGFVDHSLYIAKDIVSNGGTVITSRVSTGSEGYKTYNVYIDKITQKLTYKMPTFKMARPTSSYLPNMDVFDESVEDYMYEEFDNEDATTSHTPSGGNENKYLFTMQTFKPTNFVEFSVRFSKLTYSEIEDIVADSNYSKQEVLNNFFNVDVIAVNGAKLESFICSIDDNMVDVSGNVYAINSVINHRSNYIFIIGRINEKIGFNFNNLEDLEIKFDNNCSVYNHNDVKLTKTTGITTVTNSSDSISNALDVPTEFAKNDLGNTFIKGYLPNKISSTSFKTSMTAKIAESKTYRVVKDNSGKTFIQKGENLFNDNATLTFVIDGHTKAAGTSAKIYLPDNTSFTLTLDADNKVTSLTPAIKSELKKIAPYFTIDIGSDTYTGCSITEMLKPGTKPTSEYKPIDAETNETWVKDVTEVTLSNAFITSSINNSVILNNGVEQTNIEDSMTFNVPSNMSNISVELDADYFVEVDDIENIYGVTLSFEDETFESILPESNPDDIFIVDENTEIEYSAYTTLFNYQINTKDFKYNTKVNVGFPDFYTTDEYGFFSVDRFKIDNIIEETITNNDYTKYDLLKYNSTNTPTAKANVSAYNGEGIKNLYKNGASGISLYDLYFGDNSIAVNNVVDIVCKDAFVNADLQTSIVALVNKKQRCFATLSSKNYTNIDVNDVAKSYVEENLKDPYNKMTYKYFDDMRVEVLGPFTKARIDDNSTIAVPTLGFWVGYRLKQLTISPVLDIWGAHSGTTAPFKPLVNTPMGTNDFYSKLRINTPVTATEGITNLWNDFTTYRKNSDLNRVRNVQMIIHLMHTFHPVLMKYIKTTVSTLLSKTDNITNIKSDLFTQMVSIHGGLKQGYYPTIDLVSTNDDLKNNIIKLKVGLTFSEVIDKIHVIFQANSSGEITYDIFEN